MVLLKLGGLTYTFIWDKNRPWTHVFSVYGANSWTSVRESSEEVVNTASSSPTPLSLKWMKPGSNCLPGLGKFFFLWNLSLSGVITFTAAPSFDFVREGCRKALAERTYWKLVGWRGSKPCSASVKEVNSSTERSRCTAMYSSWLSMPSTPFSSRLRKFFKLDVKWLVEFQII